MGIEDRALASLKRIQEFNADQLIRQEDLGKKNFAEAVKPAERLISLYRRIPSSVLEDLPQNQLERLQQRSDADFQLFTEIQEFSVDGSSAERDNLVQRVRDAYQAAFDVLHPLISYAAFRSADFSRLDEQARATIQGISDSSSMAVKQLNGIRQEADTVLQAIRRSAAESGVTQEAFFFNETANDHEGRAKKWRNLTFVLAAVTGIYALGSTWLHKLAFLKPADTFESVQLAVSKILVFAVLSFVLFLSARSFAAHKHNAIVNRHRQQALQTYRALVGAAASGPTSDIVLSHAAACIYAPQPTGYSQDTTASAPSAKSVVELLSAGVAKAPSA